MTKSPKVEKSKPASPPTDEFAARDAARAEGDAASATEDQATGSDEAVAEWKERKETQARQFMERDPSLTLDATGDHGTKFALVHAGKNTAIVIGQLARGDIGQPKADATDDQIEDWAAPLRVSRGGSARAATDMPVDPLREFGAGGQSDDAERENFLAGSQWSEDDLAKMRKPLPHAPDVVARFELDPSLIETHAVAVVGGDEARAALRKFAVCIVVDVDGRAGIGVSRSASKHAGTARTEAYDAAVAGLVR